jgi:hypothetical protein
MTDTGADEPTPEAGRGSGWGFYDESDEWGSGDWESEAESPPGPWPKSSRAYLAVVVVGFVGLVLMAIVGWGQAADNLFRPGALLVAAAVCLAAVLRAWLPDETAGMLALRSRRVDTILYSALGAAAVVLAIVVPPPA